jgi:predicted PurR-regulated permease PerM
MDQGPADQDAPRSSAEMPPWIPKFLFLSILAVFVGILIWRILGLITPLLIWLLIALFVSFALEPAVNWFAAHGWRRGVATAFIMFGALVVSVVLIALLVPAVVREISDLLDRLPTLIARAQRWLDDTFGIQLDLSSWQESASDAGGWYDEVASVAIKFASSIGSLVFQAFTVGLFAFYMIAQGPRMRRAICSVLPRREQEHVLRAWELGVQKTGGYFYSRLLLGAIYATASFIVLLALGLQFALPIALWNGMVSAFIPVVGTYVGAAVPVIVALLESPGKGIVVLVFIIAYQQVENLFLSPKLSQKTMELHPAVAFGSVYVGGWLLGPLGAFLALPAAGLVPGTISSYLKEPGRRYEVVETELTAEPPPKPPKERSPEGSEGRSRSSRMRGAMRRRRDDPDG